MQHLVSFQADKFQFGRDPFTFFERQVEQDQVMDVVSIAVAVDGFQKGLGRPT